MLAYALRGERKLAGPQSLLPGLGYAINFTRAVGAREEGSLCRPLCTDKDLETLVDVASQVSCLERHVVLAICFRSQSESLEVLEVTARTIEEELAVEVVALVEALLCQTELSLHQCYVPNLLPLVGILGLFGDSERFLHSVQSQSQVEFVVSIRRHLVCQLELPVGLEELGQLRVLGLRHLLEVGLSPVHVFRKDGCLEVHQG